MPYALFVISFSVRTQAFGQKSITISPTAHGVNQFLLLPQWIERSFHTPLSIQLHGEPTATYLGNTESSTYVQILAALGNHVSRWQSYLFFLAMQQNNFLPISLAYSENLIEIDLSIWTTSPDESST